MRRNLRLIQATAPPGPNAGDLWYDGTVLRIWSGSAWMLVGPGATVGPVPTTTNVFSLVQATQVSMAAGSWVVIPFNTTPSIDTESGYDPVSKKYTPQRAGVYYFNNICYLGTGSTGAEACVLVKLPLSFFNSTQASAPVEPVPR